jgi:hypothetical protein
MLHRNTRMSTVDNGRLLVHGVAGELSSHRHDHERVRTVKGEDELGRTLAPTETNSVYFLLVEQVRSLLARCRGSEGIPRMWTQPVSR